MPLVGGAARAKEKRARREEAEDELDRGQDEQHDHRAVQLPVAVCSRPTSSGPALAAR